jgi:chemotaxis protein histidine kinase CheA
MNDLRQNFLAESINNLTILHGKLREDFIENLQRDAFRIVHTIKGGSQTLGLKNAAKLANELENLLASREFSANNNSQTLLIEGIKLLINSLQSTETNFSADFIEKLQGENQIKTKSNILLTRIPLNVFKTFSQTEQRTAISALCEGKKILCAEVGFEIGNFADEYRNLRKILCENCEMIAALPSAKFNSHGKIGFQLFLASGETVENLRKTVEDFSVEISSHACTENPPKGLFEMFSQVAAHAESVANQLGKDINFTILASETKLSAATTKTIFDILLHLVRNAIDHAIEKSGKIEIQLFDENNGLNLMVADDGKGIDLAKIKTRAIEKNLISDDDSPDESQILELIFAPEFSTAEKVTEISGRGVGLDAVKHSVEKMNGKISVKNRNTSGTIFEIFLPKKEL